VAGHQIAANLVSMLFMLPLALANATSTLVAQRVGAGDMARRTPPGLARPASAGGGLHLSARRCSGPRSRARAVHRNPAVVAAALPLLAWVALFHIADAVQALAVLRAARLPHRHRADADLRGVAVGRGPGRRLPVWPST
jgi:MATE family multidrug resistance protein